MKTAKEYAIEFGFGEEPEDNEQPTKEYEQVQRETLLACANLCIEGYVAFKREGDGQKALACDACAANIIELAREHGFEFKIKLLE